MEIQHQKQHVKQHVKHWFFAGAGKGNFQLPDTAAVSPFLERLLKKYTHVIEKWFVMIIFKPRRVWPP